MTSQRTRWIDIAKGIGILLVTIGHSRFGESVWSAIWINSFHMPLFFVMAGLCYDETRYPSCWGYLKRKSVALVYPYFMLTLFVALLMTCLYVGESKNYFYEYFIAHPFPGWTIGGFWFIRVLVIVELTYAFLFYIFPKRSVFVGVIMALGAYWQPDGYCFRLNTIMVSLAFYALGHLFRPMLKKAIPSRLLLGGTMGCFLLHAALIAVCFHVIVGYGGCSLGDPIKFYSIAILGVATVTGFSMLVDSLQRWTFIPRALAWLGKYSILLLALHGSCGTCRHSWGERWPALAGWPSQVLEIVLLVILMWLLSGPLNFFMKPPKFIKAESKS